MTIYATLDNTIDRSTKSTPNVLLAFGGYEYRMALPHLVFVGALCLAIVCRLKKAGR